MGADDDVQGGDTVGFQVVQHLVPFAVFPRINEDIGLRGLDEDGVPLTDIYHMYLYNGVDVSPRGISASFGGTAAQVLYGGKDFVPGGEDGEGVDIIRQRNAQAEDAEGRGCQIGGEPQPL